MNVLGTAFETSLRLLLLLSVCNDTGISEERICMLDYIAQYAQDFSLADTNLHGYGAYRASEYSAKRALAKEAIKSLVLDHLISVATTSSGFLYTITNDGIAFCDQLTSDYSDDYTDSAENVIERTAMLSDNEIAAMIRSRTKSDLEG